MSAEWEFAGTWQRLAESSPGRPALVHGAQVLSWGTFQETAARLASGLLDRQVQPGAVAVICLRSGVTFLTCWAASLRLGLIPAGVTHRQTSPELSDLLDLLGPGVVFFDDACREAAAQARRAPQRQQRLWCYAGNGRAPRWAVGLDTVLASSQGHAPVLATPDNLMIKCTGGTSGTPKAVLWRIGDVFRQLNDHNPWARHDLSRPPTSSRTLGAGDARVVVASPLAHGTGLTRALAALTAGGTVITPATRTLDPATVLDAVERHAADTLVIVGDAFALPLTEELRKNPRDLASLRTVASSGASWTAGSKTELLRLLPHVRIAETFGATEVTGMGAAVAVHGAVPPTGTFRLGRYAGVFTGSGCEAAPGEEGRIGVSWPHPVGLHPGRSALPNAVIEHRGQAFLLSGDRVLRLDGDRFRFLGRDEDCINTGGLKVHAPEIAEALKAHPAVIEAAVLAVPHDRLGQAVAALVVLQPGADKAAILARARARLAGYKLPRVVVEVETIPVTPAGKVDRTRARALLQVEDRMVHR